MRFSRLWPHGSMLGSISEVHKQTIELRRTTPEIDCLTVTAEDLADVNMLRLFDIEVLKKYTRRGGPFVKLSETKPLPLRKADLAGFTGVIHFGVEVLDMRDAEWDQKLFAEMPVLEDIHLIGVRMGGLPDNTFAGINTVNGQREGGVDHPSCKRLSPAPFGNSCTLVALKLTWDRAI